MEPLSNDELTHVVFAMLGPFIAWACFAVVRRRISLASIFTLTTVEAAILTFLLYTHLF